MFISADAVLGSSSLAATTQAASARRSRDASQDPFVQGADTRGTPPALQLSCDSAEGWEERAALAWDDTKLLTGRLARFSQNHSNPRFPRRGERQLKNCHCVPEVAAAGVFIEADKAGVRKARALALDFDLKRSASALAELLEVSACLEHLGVPFFADVSCCGGHIIVPLRQRVDAALVEQMTLAISARWPSVDPAVAHSGVITIPGTLHKCGGRRRLVRKPSGRCSRDQVRRLEEWTRSLNPQVSTDLSHARRSDSKSDTSSDRDRSHPSSWTPLKAADPLWTRRLWSWVAQADSELRDADVRAAGRRVARSVAFAALCNRAAERDFIVEHGVRSLGIGAGVSKSVVSKTVSVLCSAGLLEAVQAAQGVQATRFKIAFPADLGCESLEKPSLSEVTHPIWGELGPAPALVWEHLPDTPTKATSVAESASLARSSTHAALKVLVSHGLARKDAEGWVALPIPDDDTLGAADRSQRLAACNQERASWRHRLNANPRPVTDPETGEVVPSFVGPRRRQPAAFVEPAAQPPQDHAARPRPRRSPRRHATTGRPNPQPFAKIAAQRLRAAGIPITQKHLAIACQEVREHHAPTTPCATPMPLPPVAAAPSHGSSVDAVINSPATTGPA